MRAYRCAACQRLGHNRRTCPQPRYPGLVFQRGHWRRSDERLNASYAGLHDYILKHLGRVPITSRELRQRVVDDFGAVEERTFFRYLKMLREADLLTAIPVRTGDAWFLYTR